MTISARQKSGGAGQKGSGEFQAIFLTLKDLLKRNAGGLVVSSDKPNYYCLGVGFSPKFKKSFPVAWVKVSKSYVSFHFMPIYFSPKLREELSPGLNAHMQGKSCFNFKKEEKELFVELERMVRKGFAMSKTAKIL